MATTQPPSAPSGAVEFDIVQLRELYDVVRRRSEVGLPSRLPGKNDPIRPDRPETPDSEATFASKLVDWARAAVPPPPSPDGRDTRTVEQLRKELVTAVEPFGLALSGGGIRSASFSLGFLQALSRTREGASGVDSGPPTDALRHFDYLSTVSGGGYTGCMLSAVTARVMERRHPAKPDSLDEANDQDKADPVWRAEARRAVLDEVVQPRRDGLQPLWQRLLFRGQSLGMLFPFLARHIASTLVFNLMLLGGLICLGALLALLWRELDRPPVHTFLSWSSDNRVLEFNRPFLIPLAFFTAYVCVALSRPDCSWLLRLLAIGIIMAGLFWWVGLPYLLILTPTLTIVCLILTVFSRANTDGGEGETNGEASRPRLLRGMLIVVPAMVGMFLLARYASPGTGWDGMVLSFGMAIAAVTCGGLQRLFNGIGFPLGVFMGGLAAAKGALFGVLAAVVFDAPDMTDQFSGAIYPALLCATLFLVAAQLGLMFFIAAGIPRQTRRTLDQVMLGVTGATALVGLAVWVSTPNMRLADGLAVDLWQGSSSLFNQAMAVVAALLLPFVRLQDVLRSGMQTKSPAARFVFNVLSMGLLLGIPFVVIANIARHNLSGYAGRTDRPIAYSDVNWDQVLRRKEAAAAPERTPAVETIRRLFGGGVNPAGPAAYDRFLAARLAEGDPKEVRRLFESGLLAESGPSPPGPLPDLADRLRGYGVAIPLGAKTWKSAHAEYARDRDRADACSDVLHRLPVVWDLLRDRAATAYLLATCTRLQAGKADDSVDAQKKKMAGNLEPLILKWKPLAESDGAARPVGGHPILDRLDRDQRDELQSIGTLSFYVAYADLPKSRPHGFVNRPVVIEEDQAARIVVWALALIVLLGSLVAVDMNWTSALPFYRRQLQAAYLAPTPAEAHRQVPNVHDLDGPRVGLPYHLMNASVDYRSADREPALRLEPFLFSPRYCGGPWVGYRPTKDYLLYSVGDGSRSRPVNLGDVIAISGAAVNPLRVDNWLIRAVLMVTNFRLHQWLPHPRAAGDPIRPSPINVFPCWPVLPWNWKGRCFPPLLSVADGGFQDNLGVQSLLARRCETIVAVDAGADPNYAFNDLRRVLTWAHLHGIAITFPRPAGDRRDGPLTEAVTELLPRDRTAAGRPAESDSLSDAGLFARLSGRDGRGVQFHERLADTHLIVADVVYPGKRRAKLYYVKPTLNGDEPVELLSFRKAHPVFPHHSTVEQLFDPATVDAYRRLGQHIGEQLILEMEARAGRAPGAAEPALEETQMPPQSPIDLEALRAILAEQLAARDQQLVEVLRGELKSRKFDEAVERHLDKMVGTVENLAGDTKALQDQMKDMCAQVGKVTSALEFLLHRETERAAPTGANGNTEEKAAPGVPNGKQRGKPKG